MVRLAPLALLVACKGTTDDSTKPEPAFPGWVRTSADTDTYAAWGAVLETWSIEESWTNWFPTLYGDDRRFQILRPKELIDDQQAPVLLALHGSGIDDDSDPSYYDSPDTICGASRDIAAAYLSPDAPMAPFALERGWVIVAPEGAWCDGWKGLGPMDQADPEHHFGFVHLAEVKDFIDAGVPGFSPSAWYAWGSSSGGGGAVLAEAWKGGFDGIVTDSAPCDWIAYWHTDPAPVEHLFGGPAYEADGETPTSLTESYLEESCDTLVRDASFQAPVFLAHNQRDLLVSDAHGRELGEALAERPDLRTFDYDFNRFAPGFTFHTQTRSATIPMAYVTELAFRFLEGAHVRWLEAEDVCTGCETTRVSEADEGGGWDLFSHRGGVAFQGPGTALSTELVDVDEGATITAVVQVVSSTAASTLVLRHGSDEVRVATRDLIEGEDGTIEQVRAHVNALEIPAGAGTLTIEVEGEAEIRIDALALQW